MLSQERLKKLRSEHGKVQLGNITVDMVHVSSSFFCYPYFRLMLPGEFLINTGFVCSLSIGNWWNERNDRTIVGDFIT